MMETLRALAEPHRFQIVDLLLDGPRPVGDMVTQLGLRQPQVSKHLRVLSDAGLVDVRVDAQRRIYALRPMPFQQLEVWLEKYRRLWEGNFQPGCRAGRVEDRREKTWTHKTIKESTMTTQGTSKVKLQITTPSDREIAMTRVFDASRRLVFDAFTNPELVKQWLLGPPGWTMPVCEIDLRVGGQYRYVWRRESNGKEMGMGGVYREIVPQERLVCTELFDEAWYAGESLITATLVEQGGRTTMTSTMLYVSQEARDGVLKSGMESGVAASYDRLAELLASAKR